MDSPQKNNLIIGSRFHPLQFSDNQSAVSLNGSRETLGRQKASAERRRKKRAKRGGGDDSTECLQPLPIAQEGKYDAICVGYEFGHMWGRRDIYLHFELCDPLFDGLILHMVDTAPSKRITPRYDYYKSWVVATGRVPMKRGFPSPKVFVGAMFTVEVVTVKTDWKSNPLPEPMWYSVVDRLVRRIK